jgi:hypothetical protein
LKTTFSSGEKAPGDLYDEKLKEIAGLDSNTNTKITSLMNAVHGIKDKLPESADKDVKEIKSRVANTSSEVTSLENAVGSIKEKPPESVSEDS